MNGTDPEKPPKRISIRLLRIERFRGIEKLEWLPAPGLNVIVGPGDSCKSTILEAIGALLSPAPNINISEFDYFRRNIDQGFEVEAVLAIGDGSILKADRFPPPPLRGRREGQLTDLPDEGGAEAVMVCRLTGTPDQEAVHEIIGLDQETRVPFPRALRQRIGLLRLGVADRWDRDLRLVQGGALDRFMEGPHLRQSILQAILNTPIHDRLGNEPKEALGRIDKQFRERSLPNPVRLGLVGTPGVSLAASVGLMIGENDESALPLPAWGTGTRRLASLELASVLADRMSLAVVDEPESGLEPYRQRAFIVDLSKEGKRQAFITTHAPAILAAGAAAGAVISRINTAPIGEAAEAADEDRPAGGPRAHD
jgi:putative ATP-dependent endonuclease of OLD family